MLSFELSVIDLILVIAVIILLILYITKPSMKTSEEKLLIEKEKPSKKPTTEETRLEKETERPIPEPQRDSTGCPYSFGYLKKLGKNAAIPDECLSCSRMMKCLYSNE